MTTASPLDLSARALIAALRDGNGRFELEAYEAFRAAALATSAAGHPDTALAAVRHVMHMRPWGSIGPIGGNLSIPFAAGLTS